MHFSKYPNKMPEVSSFEFFASQNIPQNIWFHSIFNIYERYTKSICRDIYVIRYQIYEDSVFTVHIFLRHLEISQMYLIHAPRDNFSHWVLILICYIFSTNKVLEIRLVVLIPLTTIPKFNWQLCLKLTDPNFAWFNSDSTKKVPTLGLASSYLRTSILSVFYDFSLGVRYLVK